MRRFWALSMVPVDDVVQVWEELVLPTCPDPEEERYGDEDDLEEFIEYLTKALIGPMNERSGVRRNPIFRHSVWNKVKAIMNEDPTTTNCCEGYNHAIQLSIPHNASIWSIVKQLKAEEALVTVKLREAAVGAGQDNSSRTTYRRQRRNELKELVTNYSVLSKKRFMDYMIVYYNHDLSFDG